MDIVILSFDILLFFKIMSFHSQFIDEAEQYLVRFSVKSVFSNNEFVSIIVKVVY